MTVYFRTPKHHWFWKLVCKWLGHRYKQHGPLKVCSRCSAYIKPRGVTVCA